jgi:peptidoglycan/LPS O-acetylase OafA/YrhL
MRRFFRLMPSAWLWLGMGIVVATLLTDSFHTSALLAAKSAAFAVIGLANFYWASCYMHDTPQLFAICGHPEINSIYWSLSLEEQCYLALSLMGMILGYRSIAALAIFALLVQAMLPRSYLSWSWFVRTDAFFWGVLLYGFSRTAFYKDSARRLSRRWLMAALGLALTVLLLTLKQATTWDVYGLGISLVGFAAVICVWIASYDHGCFGRGWLAASLVWIGDRSYSLYLSHFLIYMALFQMLQVMNMEPLLETHGQAISSLIVPIVLFLAFGVAHVSYIWIEQPFRTLGRRLSASIAIP